MAPNNNNNHTAVEAYSNMNLALLDPGQYGWSAGGTVVNVITPQEALRRKRRNKGRTSAAVAARRANASSRKPTPKAASAILTSPLANLPSAAAATAAAAPSTATTASTTVSSAVETAAQALASLVQSPVAPKAVATTTSPHSPFSTRAAPPLAPAIMMQKARTARAAPPVLKFKSLVLAPDDDNNKSTRGSYKVESLHQVVENGDNANNNKEAPSPKNFVDMYTYHRGREGFEMGDDLEPNDSGATYNACAKFKMQLHVKFPLSDDEEDVVYWDEMVEWNVFDPPITLATRIAQDFGLTFGATQDLEHYLQNQIDTIRGDSVYPDPPVVFNDTLHDSSTSLPSRPCHLYGTGKGGMPMKPKKKKKQVPTAAAAAGPSTKAAAAPAKPARRSSSIRDQTYVFKSPPAYREIVQQRAKKECEFASQDLVPKTDYTCHLCVTRKPQCSMFPCLIPHHVYCAAHLQSELKLSAAATKLDYCPICCVTCSCHRCHKRLDQVALELQKRTPEGADPHQTELPNILLYCAGKIQVTKPSTASNRKGGAKSFSEKLIIVPKVAATEFPREMCGARDMEPGTEIDYRTIFTASGAYLDKDKSSGGAPAAAPAELVAAEPPAVAGGVPEDGNVDYCQTCRLAGNLLCCDYCPRAFHEKCVEKKEGSEGKWECPVCLEEKGGLPQDAVRGKAKYKDTEKTCLEMICAAFVAITPVQSQVYLETMLLLAMVLEMVLHLMDYEFGYMFAEPVDVAAIPEYGVVVKKPMDLGTIADRLVKGYYSKLFNAETQDWNNVVAQVLKDIELVWHNCFLFNFEGSSIYRMAEVHARRSRNTRKRSFDYLIKDPAKKQLDEFVKACVAERAPIANLGGGGGATTNKKTSHQIRVPWAPGGKCRSVAVLDPDTSRVIKLYTTLRSACMAANYIQSLGRKAEWSPLSDYTIKNLIKKGKDDPKLTLFGHRWLFYDELRLGEVTFGPTGSSTTVDDSDWTLPRMDNDSMIQMMHGQVTYLFLSIAEAVSFSTIPKEVPLAEVQDRLVQMPFDKWMPMCGMKWRKVTPHCEDDTSSSENHVAIIKEDTVTGRRLMGFDSARAAYEDWCRERTTSPMLRKKGYSLDFFKKDYLTGRKKVDGLMWRALTKSEQSKMKKQRDALVAVGTQVGIKKTAPVAKRPLESSGGGASPKKKKAKANESSTVAAAPTAPPAVPPAVQEEQVAAAAPVARTAPPALPQETSKKEEEKVPDGGT